MRRRTLRGDAFAGLNPGSNTLIGSGNNNISGGTNLIKPSQNLVEQDFESADCIKFTSCARQALQMFNIENILLYKIFSDGKEKVIASKLLERIFDPILRFLNVEAEVSPFKYNNLNFT
jgi:hypothetical protein